MAARSIVSNATFVALSSMHPHLHPARRPPWYLRMRALRVATHRLTDSQARAQLVGTAAATKEAVRRLLATVVMAVPATQAVLALVNHPVGLLTSPPVAMPHRGMEAAMTMFACTGVALATGSASYTDTVCRFFRQATTEDRDDSVVWDKPWLGRGTASSTLLQLTLHCCGWRN